MDGNVSTFTDGYEGEWKEGAEHGRGTREYPDGSKYEGEWKDGKRHGRGTCEYADRGKYEGEWKDGKRHGHGVLTLEDGWMYEGMWMDNRIYGHGRRVSTDGTSCAIYTLHAHEIDSADAHRAATDLQRYARCWLARKLVGHMRAEQATLLTPEEALSEQMRELERSERRNGVVRTKRLTPSSAAPAPRAAARTRCGGGRTRATRRPRPVEIEAPCVPWCDEIHRGQLKKQMDRARHERATAANTKAAPVAPPYLDVIDLHTETRESATQTLRATILTTRPLKHCNHLMVITGKGEHGDYACLKGHLGQLLDGAWQATYMTKRAGDGKGTDGFYVKITKKLQKHVRGAGEAQQSPTRPTVSVRPRK